MYYNQPNQLPANPDQIDQRTINNNLPAGNDVRCFLTPGPRAQDIAPFCVGMFRKQAQDRYNKSRVHTVVYNILADGYFQNQVFQEWVQRCVDFTEFLIVTQNMHPQQAAEVASAKIYACFFAVTVANYLMVFEQNSMLSQDMKNQSVQYAQEFEQIQRNVGQFKQQAAQQQQYGQPGYHAHNPGTYASPGYAAPAYVTPPVTYSVTPHGVQAAPPGYAPPVSPLDHARNNAVQYNAPAPVYVAPSVGGAPAMQRGRVDDYVTAAPAPVAPPPGAVDPYARLAPQPLKPVETFGSHTGGSVMRDVTPNRNLSPIEEYSTQSAPVSTQPAVAAQHSVIEMGYDDEPLAPSNLGEVVINAAYYRPAGAPPAKEGREYDLVYNPGGVLIVPAHLSEWTRTWSIESPYALNAIPNTEIKWHVKWPDGLVQEVVTAVEPEMDYLRHELLQSLQVSKKQYNGKVIPDLRRVESVDFFDDSTLDIKPETHDLVSVPDIIELEEQLDDSGRFLDNANRAAELLRTNYELGDSDELPVHMYTTVHEEPLVFGDKAARMEVQRLTSCESLQELAQEMSALIENGILEERHARLLNDRMTLAVNHMLGDSLALPTVKISSFVDDIDELFELLVKKCGQGILATIAQFAQGMINTWMNLGFGTKEEEVDGEINRVSDWDVLYLVDTTVVLQTQYSLGELGRMPLNSNEATLISGNQHPNLYKFIVAFIQLSRETGLVSKHLTLVTADGVRIDVLIGWLRKGAVLLRRHPQVV